MLRGTFSIVKPRSETPRIRRFWIPETNLSQFFVGFCRYNRFAAGRSPAQTQPLRLGY